jgi:hypothetical protein
VYLANFGNFDEFLMNTDEFWRNLMTLGDIWWILMKFDECWIKLKKFDEFWRNSTNHGWSLMNYQWLSLKFDDFSIYLKCWISKCDEINVNQFWLLFYQMSALKPTPPLCLFIHQSILSLFLFVHLRLSLSIHFPKAGVRTRDLLVIFVYFLSLYLWATAAPPIPPSFCLSICLTEHPSFCFLVPQPIHPSVHPYWLSVSSSVHGKT